MVIKRFLGNPCSASLPIPKWMQQIRDKLLQISQTLVHTHRSPKEAIPHIKPNLPFEVMDILQNTVDVKSQPVPLNHQLPVLKNTLQVQYAQQLR
jgi:hypothetical protein